MERIVRVADEMRQHPQPEDNLRHRLIAADQNDDRLRLLLDALPKMRSMNVGAFFGQSAVDARSVLGVQSGDDQAEIVRREPCGAFSNLMISSAGPGVGGERNEKEKKEWLHQRDNGNKEC